MNRTERLLQRLDMAAREGLCLAEVPHEDAYTMRNAVAEATAAGYKIRSERCRKHRHSSTVSRYFKEGGTGEKLTTARSGAIDFQVHGAAGATHPAVPLDLIPGFSRPPGHGGNHW